MHDNKYPLISATVPMKNRFVVTEVEVQANDITCRYAAEGDPAWKKCFNAKESALHLHYSRPIADVPPGIAVIPLICDVLPIAWLFDAEIEVEELDEAFLNSIPEFKRGYANMYPEFEFKGTVSVRRPVACRHATENAALFFSGGVDSFNTLIVHLSEKPALITLWGADIAWDNEAGWQPIKRMAEGAAEAFGLPHHLVRSNFRKIISEYYLTKHVSETDSERQWWHDFQHGLAIIGHAAPIAFQYGIGQVYIASTFTAAESGKFVCASDPTIDNFVRFGSAAVHHDGYECNRQQKTRNICRFAEREGIDIPLHVCWLARDGKNCCNCEKCWRTMMGILAEGGDPKRMGFDDYDDAVRKNMLRRINKEMREPYRHRFPYIQAHLRERYTLETCPPDLRRFYRYRFDRGIPGPLKLYYRCKNKLLRGRKRLLGVASKLIRRVKRRKGARAAHV